MGHLLTTLVKGPTFWVFNGPGELSCHLLNKMNGLVNLQTETFPLVRPFFLFFSLEGFLWQTLPIAHHSRDT